MKYFHLVVAIAFAYLLQLAEGHVIVYRVFSNQLIEEFYDLPASFGPPLPSTGLRVLAINSDPRDACEPPKSPPPNYTELVNQYVLIVARKNCTFEQKVRNAQISGYNAVIVYNVGSDELEQMSAENDEGIKIPSVFIGETSGRYILEAYLYDSDFMLVINDELPFNINTHLIIPFSILVGLCFIIMIVYMVYKCAREQRRIRQHRLPKKLLKKLPIIKFTKIHPYETCVICLEEFVEGDKMRVLPCSHAYHCQCIDPWLTKNRRVCPICKRKVFVRGESRRSRRRNASSDSMSESETDDTTPLLNPVGNSNNHGTFASGQNANARDNGGNTATEDNRVEGGLSSGRVNPFDRVPNLPPNLVQESNRELNFWNLPIIRLFRRRYTAFENSNTSEQEQQIPQQHEDAASVAVNLPPRPASNNILNANLSGSFKDNDDEHVERGTIYEPSGSRSSVNNAEHDNESDSIYIQTPTQGGIGVAALPNSNFVNDAPPNRRSTGPRQFIV